jgi:hypothetical protein
MRPDRFEPKDPRDGRWEEPDLPAGAGEVHAPSGGFAVQALDLVNAAKEWDELSGDMVDVRTKCETGWGLPGIFGYADVLYTVGRLHDAFNRKACDAAWDGHVITGLVANGLVEVANDFSHTDTTTGDNFRDYKRVMD